MLEGIFRKPTNDAAEKERRNELLWYVTISPICIWYSVPPRKFKDIGRQLQSLSEKSGLQRFANHVQDDKKVSELLEDLRETVSDYQVCL